MPGRAAINGGATPAQVLCDVRRHVKDPQIGYELRRIIALVGADCDAPRARRVPHDHLLGCLALRPAIGLRQLRLDNEPALRFSVSTCPMKLSLASFPT